MTTMMMIIIIIDFWESCESQIQSIGGMVIDSSKPKHSSKYVSHCQVIRHELHVCSRVTDPNRLTAVLSTV